MINIVEYQSMTDTIGNIASGLIVVFLISVLVSFISMHSRGFVIFAISMVTSVILALIFAGIYRTRIETCNDERVAQGYAIYLDGREVSGDKIDIDLYRVRYNDEKRCLYISNKVR